ncbi:GIY-YIG nuclease family protein [Sulfuricaulis sp.]|jgi:hypothetical protein|uniref:GIY-YIG nuclease family protein n=1 Tax=Sulfuricaulis sp. TaxID=2003553 RepID=UPI003559F944
MSPELDQMKTIGFVKAGQWQLREGGIDYELESQYLTARNVLYAFVANERVMYIGKTTQALRARIDNYKYATKPVNLKNQTNIINCLNSSTPVAIFVLPDNGLLHYGRFHLNLAAGLEDSLIRDLSPPWNGGRKGS